MAEKGKSKTDVSARAEAKGRIQRCSICGNKVEVVLAVSASGREKNEARAAENNTVLSPAALHSHRRRRRLPLFPLSLR
jgi:hypothetical protein